MKFIDGNQITRTISSTISRSLVLMMNSATFMFSRTSELGSTSGLMSKLVISSVSQSLNETNITCKEVSPSEAKAATMVYIIGNTSGNLIIVNYAPTYIKLSLPLTKYNMTLYYA